MSAKITSSERQNGLASHMEDVFDDGYLRVEHDNYYATCHGRVIDLPRAEFLIVSRLTRNPERTVPAEELWQVAWGTSKPFNPVSLRVYIYRVRIKLEPYGLKIETMVNVGYRLLLASSNKPAFS
jgi:DNA-binding response OmpR family regulator